MEQKQELTVGYILVAIALGLLTWISYHNLTEHEPTLDDFYHAIAQIESEGDPLAVGSSGEIGMHQITYGYWLDSMEYINIGGTHDSCSLEEYSKLIMQGYFRRYANKAWQEKNFYDLARIHHGGWNGRNRIHTIKYAERVVALMGAE